MESLIETFHIDAKLIIAQMINFAIVFGVLYFFALKPLAKIMQDRTNKIEKGLEDAKKVEAELENAKQGYEQAIADAKKEANELMEKANVAAEAKKKDMVNKAKEEIGQVINQEKAKMQEEKAETLREIREEIAGLVVAAVEKVLEEKLDTKKDHELIKRITS
jgi:F-type H+-transporting ATPase subunit b